MLVPARSCLDNIGRMLLYDGFVLGPTSQSNRALFGGFFIPEQGFAISEHGFAMFYA